MADIRTLREAVEAGELSEVNAALGRWFHIDHSLPWSLISNVNSAFRGSLDAAKALHDALLPGWVARPQIGGAGAGVSFWHCTIEDWESGEEIHAHNMPNPARAWLIAILKALEARTNG